MSFFNSLGWPIIQIVWLLLISGLAIWLYVHYRRLVQGVSKKNLLSILELIQKQTDLNTKQINQLTLGLKETQLDVAHHLQKVGLVRFNPFAETGGNQSFCLALLDTENSGIVISSLHSRESTRIYAKPVLKGKALDFAFSEEEEQAVKKAKKIK